MTEEPPARFKEREDWTVEEIVAHKQTGKAPETPEYKEARSEAREAAGLDSEDDVVEAPPPSEPTPDGPFDLRRHW